MFQAAHITLIQAYPFWEPVFAPERLRGVSRWPIQLGKRKDTESVHRAPDIFNYLPALRTWLREGYRIHVPGYGSMKALRKPVSLYDSFYQPFLHGERLRDANVKLPENRGEKGPLPFFPIQVMMTEQELSLRHQEIEENWFQSWLGSTPQGWVVKPMLMVYPAGAISAQFRLFVEGREELTAAQLDSLLTGFANWPWALVRPSGEVAAQDHGVPALLDEMVRRFLGQILEQPVDDVQRQPETMTLINLQGALPTEADGAIAAPVADAVYTLTGIKRSEREAWMSGNRRQPGEPWTVVGRERIALLLDSAVRAHTRYRDDGRLLQGRRAMRNRALSTVEMALVSHRLFGVYGDYFAQEGRYWEVDALRSALVRLRDFVAGPHVPERVWTTFFYEVALVMKSLEHADKRNKVLWLSLFQQVQARASARGNSAEASLQQALTYGRQLLEQKRAHSAQQWAMLGRALDYLVELMAALVGRGDAL